MKTVLVISFSPLHRDPRVYRQIVLLREHFRVIAAGFTDPQCDVDWCPIDGSGRGLVTKMLAVLYLKLGRFSAVYESSQSVRSFRRNWAARTRDNPCEVDLAIANDVHALPVALDVAGGSPVVIDAHEYSPEVRHGFVWEFLMADYEKWLCRKYLARADLMTTVADAIAEKYRVTYGVDPLVVFNAPYHQDLEPSPVAPERIRLVHHGIATPERGLEEMISLFETLDDRFSLDFYLMESNAAMVRYVGELKRLARAYGGRIRFNRPVDMRDLPREISQYDIGLLFVRPTNFNNANSMPNKFFEFVQARLAIVSGPTPEVAGLIREYSMGTVSQTFEPRDMASALNQLSTEDVARMKLNADRAADTFCYEKSSRLFLEKVTALLA